MSFSHTAPLSIKTAPSPLSQRDIQAGVGGNQKAEKDRGAYAANQGAQGVENCNREGTQLQGENFADREISGASGGTGDKEDYGEADSQSARAKDSVGEGEQGSGEQQTGDAVAGRNHRLAANLIYAKTKMMDRRAEYRDLGDRSRDVA